MSVEPDLNVIKTYDDFRECHGSREEISQRRDLLALFQACPIPERDLLSNLGLYSGKTEIARLLYLHEIYQKILKVPGVIMEFGVRWGQNLALYEAFRGIYEPFNRARKIIGFDTFQGFTSVSAHDADATVGELSVTPGYEEYLEKLLATREREGALTHLKRFELIRGDAIDTVPGYLDRHPETIISLAFFDMDLYEPTKAVLETIQQYLTRGSVVVFDELAEENYPGETIAAREVFGLDRVALTRSRYSSNRSYLVYGQKG